MTTVFIMKVTPIRNTKWKLGNYLRVCSNETLAKRHAQDFMDITIRRKWKQTGPNRWEAVDRTVTIKEYFVDV